MDSFSTEFGYQPGEVIGWMEKDGEPGPTSEEELVRLEDDVGDDATIHVECNNWYGVWSVILYFVKLIYLSSNLKRCLQFYGSEIPFYNIFLNSVCLFFCNIFKHIYSTCECSYIDLVFDDF